MEWEQYVEAIEHVLRGEAFPLLLRWLSESAERLCSLQVLARVVEACVGAPAFPLSAISEGTAAGPSGRSRSSDAHRGPEQPPPQPTAAAAAASTDTAATTTTLLQAHSEALQLLCFCLAPGTAAAQDHAAQLARSGGGSGGAAQPPPLPRRLESLSRAARSVLMSHLLRRHARLAEQAATAAGAAAADMCGSGGSGGSSSSSTSSSRSGGGSSSTAAGYQSTVLASLLSTLTVALSHMAEFRRALLPLQPAAAAPVPPPPAAALRGGGGGGGKGNGKGGGAAGASAGRTPPVAVFIGGASSVADRDRPLAELLVLELARSGLLDQVARLVLHSAKADGTPRRQQQKQRELTGLVAGSCSSSTNGSGSSNSSSSISGSLSLPGSDMTFGLAAPLCRFVQAIGEAWCAAGMRGGHGSSSTSTSTSSGSSSTGTGSSSSGLPLPWGTCLQTLALAQVVVTLEVAGFGGGERGIWGLPAELAAGLPLLAHTDNLLGLHLRVAQHHQPSGCGRAEPLHLSADPFKMLNRIAYSLNVVAMEVSTAACAPPGCAPTSAGACGATSAQADTGAGGRGAGGDCWSFPISPRATALMLLRVADLAAASLERPVAVAVAAVGEPASAPVGPQAPAPLLRLCPADAWSEGMSAVLNARQLLMRRRNRHRLQGQQMAAAAAPAPAPRSSSTAASGGGGASGSSASRAADSAACGDKFGDEYGDVYPRLPVAWWRTLASMLPHAMAPPRDTGCMSPDEAAGRATQWAKMVLAGDFTPPNALLPRAPPALATALAGGLVPGVEAAVRAAPSSGLAMECAAAFLQVDIAADANAGAGWPLFRQLLAFAPPTQMVALITSMGKRGHLAVDGVAAAVAGGGSAVAITASAGLIYPVVKTFMVLLPKHYILRGAGVAAGAGAACSTGGNGGWGVHDASRSPHLRRLRLLVSHALHCWLPVLSRCARLSRADRPAGSPLAMLSPYSLVLHWCVPPMCILACEEAISAAGRASLSTSRAAAEFPGPAAAMAARAAAAVASWRQLLFHDIELVPLLEAALRLLAALPARDPAAAGAVQRVAFMLAMLPLAAPDVLVPVLRQPLPPDSPWRPAALAAALQKHMPGCSAEHMPAYNALSQLRAAAAEATPAELRAGYMGGPVARAAHVPRMEDGMLGDLSPLAATSEAEALEVEAAAAAAAASCRRGSAGGGSAAASSSSSSSAAAMAAASMWTLRCCANPRCANLAGRSEAELPLQVCGGCKAVRYCGRACQAAHWRAGHKEACGALKGKGGAGAGAGAGG
ncbi:hypothetical protein HXX76_012276 [Chlamydomonas incerta]|uniref:phytol kinase n=1 Tax=Chlamydomonas incerta TaxID=51695 RepID=A0A835SW48_CHLIN|nr:hypothetical protein HXX76_012276 [Chlamydomonas incerta]|eukprot:KAG2427625.1 hypothetical protein HXX76_012276 [Chlamydomonas incerta]